MLRLVREGKTQRVQWLDVPEIKQELLKHGIEIANEGPRDATLVITELYVASAVSENPAPIIVIDTSDPVTIRPQLVSALHDPRVKAILRGIMFRKPHRYNDDIWGVDSHHLITRAAALDDPRRKFPIQLGATLTPEQLARVKLGFPLALVSPHGTRRIVLGEKLPPCPPLQDRPIDVSFMGQLVYIDRATHDEGFVVAPQMHREFMCRQLEELRAYGLNVHLVETNGFNKMATQVNWIDNHKFLETLGQSKVIVSPWGWSCWSHRDFDAITAGGIIIKPRCDDVVTIPDVFASNTKWFHWCQPDMSDLADQVREVLRRLSLSPEIYNQRHRIDHPEQLRKACAPEQVAARLAGYIREALQT